MNRERQPLGAGWGFLSTHFFLELSHQSFAKHRATPDVSPTAHFALKHRELQAEVSGKTFLYLDTNHWINLRHVVLNSPSEKQGYREILDLLADLHEQRRICCPISLLLFTELMKQTDVNTRLHTANLMDRFSGGLCFQFPLEMARAELRHFLLKTVPGRPISELKPWVWTKSGFVYGHLLPTDPRLPDQTNWLAQKAWIDLMWHVGLEHILEGVDSFDAGTDFWTQYAAASNQDAAFYRSSQLPYKQVLEREKALLIRRLLDDELESVGREIWEAFPEDRDISKQRPASSEMYSPWNLPSLQIVAGISASDMMTRMKFEANDVLDYRHAALAIPYCDVVFCDNPLATRLRNKPCEFRSVYGTEILGRPGEILDYLKVLAR